MTRPNGISAVISSCNEPWIAESLLSLDGFADEVVLIDCSSDDTFQRAVKAFDISRPRNTLHRLISERLKIPNGSLLGDTDFLVHQNNLGMSLASFKWIVKWDADFVAYTKGEYELERFRKYLLSLPCKYCAVQICFNECHRDLDHTTKSSGLIREEPFAYTWNPRLRWRAKEGKTWALYEVLPFPFYYHKILTRRFRIVHLATVKPDERLRLRCYWTGWRWKPEGCLTIQEYCEKYKDDGPVWREKQENLMKRDFPLPTILEGKVIQFWH